MQAFIRMHEGFKDFPWDRKELVYVRYKEMDLLPFARSLFVGKLSRGGVARRVWSDPVTMANEDGRSESRRDARPGQVSVVTGDGGRSRVGDLEPRLRCPKCDARGKAVVSIRWAAA